MVGSVTTEKKPFVRKSKNLSIDILANWGYRILLILGVFASLWLNQNYVTRKEFHDVNTRLRKIEDVLIRMEVSAQINARQDLQLSDQDKRIRDLEVHCLKK